MPDLPKITITTNQWNRLKDALSGDTVAEKTVEYEAIVREALTRHVLEKERETLYAQHQAALEQALRDSENNPDNLMPPVEAP